MFGTKTFESIPCPFQGGCLRGEACHFSHVLTRPPIPLLSFLEETTPTPTQKRVKVSHPRQSNSSSTLPTSISVARDHKTSTSLPSTTQTSTLTAAAIPSHSPVLAPHPTTAHPFIQNKPPKLLPSLTQKISTSHRQKVLTLYYEQFIRIYAPLLTPPSSSSPSSSPSTSLYTPSLTFLAHEHALEQEERVHASSTPKSYTVLSVSVLRRLKQRPTSVSREDVGMDGSYVPLPLPLTSDLLSCHVHDKTLLVENFFPCREALGERLCEQEGGRVCERCGNEWSDTTCTFHPKRLETRVLNGENVKVYGCCYQDVVTEGCCVSRHVFKNKSLKVLNALFAFVETGQEEEAVDVCALDCEMVYTTQGFELAHLSLVGQDGEILIDEQCLTQGTVICLNTMYSGVHSLKEAKHTLESMRALFMRYVGKDTIVIGHGLENDFAVMHYKVVDTSLLFVNKRKGYKHSLKHLVKMYIGKNVQEGEHSSLEDAKSCLALLRERIKPDFKEHG